MKTKKNNMPIKLYKGIFTQDAESAPTVTIRENSLGAINWTRNSVGYYTGSLLNAFTAGKTDGWGFWVIGTEENSLVAFHINYVDQNTIEAYSWLINMTNGEYTPVDLGGRAVQVLIEVYP